MKRKLVKLLVLSLLATSFCSSNVFATPQAGLGETLAYVKTKVEDPWEDDTKEYYRSDPTSSNWVSLSPDTVPLSQNKVIYTISSDKYKDQAMFTLPWDLQVREMYPTFYESGQYVDQGINSSDWHGTCGETAVASMFNRMFDTNVYTENNVLSLSSLLHTCILDGDKWHNGGQTPINIVTLINSMGNITGDYAEAYYLMDTQTPKAEQIADMLVSGNHIILSVASSVLYDWSPAEAQSYGVANYYNSDHWLLVTEPVYTGAKQLVGFWLCDSSGYNHQYATLEKFNNMLFGPTGTEVINPGAVIVKPLSSNSVPSTSVNKATGLKKF